MLTPDEVEARFQRIEANLDLMAERHLAFEGQLRASHIAFEEQSRASHIAFEEQSRAAHVASEERWRTAHLAFEEQWRTAHMDLEAAQKNGAVRHDREMADMRAVQQDLAFKLGIVLDGIDRLTKNVDRFLRGRGSNGQES